MRDGRYIRTPFFRTNKNGNFPTPKRLLIGLALLLGNSFHCRSGICYRMLSFSILHLLVSAIRSFRDRFYFHQLLRCYLFLLRSVLKLILRLTYSLLFRNHFVVPFPISILYFSLVVFVIGRFFLTTLVGFLPSSVLPREKTSIVSGFPGVSNPVWL